jgi:hypothetical protein
MASELDYTVAPARQINLQTPSEATFKGRSRSGKGQAPQTTFLFALHLEFLAGGEASPFAVFVHNRQTLASPALNPARCFR